MLSSQKQSILFWRADRFLIKTVVIMGADFVNYRFECVILVSLVSVVRFASFDRRNNTLISQVKFRVLLCMILSVSFKIWLIRFTYVRSKTFTRYFSLSLHLKLQFYFLVSRFLPLISRLSFFILHFYSDMVCWNGLLRIDMSGSFFVLP